MTVSHPQIKKFLLELIDQSNFPGSMAQFIVEVKREIEAAEVEERDNA